MPSIEITDEQARALAAGRDITVAATRQKYIAVSRKTAAVYLLTNVEGDIDRDAVVTASWDCLRSHDGSKGTASARSSIHTNKYTWVPVSK